MLRECEPLVGVRPGSDPAHASPVIGYTTQRDAIPPQARHRPPSSLRRDDGRMYSWDSLTVSEQALLRRALQRGSLAGGVQQYGTDLRWAGVEGAPLRTYTDDEQRALVPRLAAVASELVDRGLIVVRAVQGARDDATDPVLTGAGLWEVLEESDNWLSGQGPSGSFSLAATDVAIAQWLEAVQPTLDTGGLPGWEDLSVDQRRVLVCAVEGSGWLTGPFGIWEDLPADLDAAGRAEWVDRQLAPLLPFVRAGWIEVRHVPAAGGGAYAAVPLGELRAAFADRELRYDDGDDWGVGFTCVFTYAGLAIWRGGWSAGWARRLTFD